MSHWSCGFEAGDKTYYENYGFVFNGASTNIITTAGRVHQSLSSRGGSNALNIEDDMDTPVFGTGGRWFHFWMEGAPSNDFGVMFNRLASPNFTVMFLTTGVIQLRLGATNGTIVAGGGFRPAIAHWVAIEANLQSSGQVTVYIDGVQVAQYTGNTQNTATADWDQVRFDSNNINLAVDDLIATTAAEGRLGEHFIPKKAVNGNDVINSEATSTGGAGSYTNVVDNPPDGDTSYNEFTVTNLDRYTTATLGWTPASVHAVTVWGYAARDGTLTQAQLVCATDTSGGGVTESLGTADGLGASGVYAAWMDTFNDDPDTATSWTAGGLADLRIGAKFL